MNEHEKGKVKNLKGIIALVAGVLVILFGLFWLLVDDLNGGKGERMMSFWIYEAISLIVGIFLIMVGVRKLRC